jgi:hypothetical protein
MAQRCRELMSEGAAWTAVLLVATAFVAGSATAAEGSRPDLVETRVATSVQAVQVGGSLRVTDTVLDRGGSRATRSKTGFYLAGARADGPHGLRLGTRAVPNLRPHAASRASTTLQIPGSSVPGSYRVFACADAGHRLRESNESNNCRAAPAIVVVIGPGGDRSVPLFAGLKAATTCIPGPAGGARTTSYHLKWGPATDNVTPSNKIVYDVFQSTKAGDEKFSTATYTTPTGATSFATPPLSADTTYFFVVRARDEAGNRDSNRVERVGENLCV